MRFPRDARRLGSFLAAALLLALLAGCGTGGSSPETTSASDAQATSAASTGAEAPTTAESAPPPDTGSAQTAGAETAPATTGATGEAGGTPASSCADDHGSASVESLACSWIADADPSVCSRMTDRLLTELFGSPGSQGKAQCRTTLESLASAGDPSLVTLAKPERHGKRTTLVVTDRNQDIVYALDFTRRSGGWAIDAAQQLSNAGATGSEDEEPETVTPNSPGDDGEIAALVTRWYAEVDPGVCDSMTNAMLRFGWGSKGAKGRTKCEKSIRAADPVEDVEVRRPAVDGDRATVEVVYTLDGDRQVDEITLVRRNGAWLIDAVRLSGFAS